MNEDTEPILILHRFIANKKELKELIGRVRDKGRAWDQTHVNIYEGIDIHKNIKQIRFKDIFIVRNDWHYIELALEKLLENIDSYNALKDH